MHGSHFYYLFYTVLPHKILMRERFFIHKKKRLILLIIYFPLQNWNIIVSEEQPTTGWKVILQIDSNLLIIDDCKSDNMNVLCGVPQGSILGPQLFQVTHVRVFPGGLQGPILGPIPNPKKVKIFPKFTIIFPKDFEILISFRIFLRELFFCLST